MKQAHRSIIATALALPLLAMAFAHDIGEAHAASMGYDFSAPSDYGISNGSELQVTGGRAVLRGKDLGFVAGDIAGDLGSSDDVAHGDLDGDGDLDLHISNYNQQNRLWVNDGLGNFTGNDIVGDLGSSFESKMFDVDGDGDLDIYVANYSNQQNRLWVNDGQGNFTGNDIVGDTFPSRGISFGDLDGGGDLDMHVTNNGQNQLWVNDGLGNFAANNIPTDLGDSFSSSVGDIDGDGDLDIHVANLNGEQNRLWVNDGLGNFTGNDIVGDLNHSTGSLMEDIDGDGDLDIYVVNSGAQQNRLWINDGSGSFTAGDIAGDTGNSRFSVIADFNGDGNRDVYIANNAGSNEQNRLWKNDGALNFAPDDIVGDLGASTGATAFDANGDGRQDIYVTNTANQQNRLWVNRGAAYPSTSPYVQPTGPLGFTTLIQSFTETLGTGNQGNVTYQVSTDNGTTWYYWDGSTWTMTIQTDGTESSPAGDIDTNIAGLDTDGGDFLWRAYLNSDGTQAVELDQVDIGHDRVPNAPAGAPDLTAASDSGSSDTDNITNITAPGFELECTGPGNTLSLYTDSPTANTPIGTHSCGTAGPVTITAGTLGEGTHSITYTEANESGEGAGSPALSITIDTTAPTPPATPDLQQGSDTGILNTDNLTSDATPSLDLECPEAGAALILTTDNPSPDTVLASYPSCTLGSLSATLSTMSPDGVHRLILEITDTAGNSTESNPLVLTLDTAILPTTIDAPTRGEPVSGTAEANSGITETGISFGIGDAPTATRGEFFPSGNVTLGRTDVNKIIGNFNGFGALNIGKVVPNFYLDIKAMEAAGTVKIKSEPKLTTINGHRAYLSNRETTFYAVTSQTFFGSQIPSTSEIRNYYPIDAELALTIQPFVSGDGQITLDIEVIQSAFTGDRIAEDAPPGTTSREFSSIVRMEDRDVVILGGIESILKDDSGSGVPFLARIPVIKWFFSKRRREASKRELNVVIKPTIIE